MTASQTVILLAVVGAATSAPASTIVPTTVVLTFDQLGNIPISQDDGMEPILNYYAGGYAGNGTASCGFTVCGPGPNYGITFESNAIVGTSKDFGGSGNFSGEPSPNGAVSFYIGTGDIMNVAGGFQTRISFFYSAVMFPGTVSVWSGPDATGTLLTMRNLPSTPSGGDSCNQPYCPSFPIGVSFSGVADSVDFGGSADGIGFDNITLPITATPEPAALVLVGSGLLGIAVNSRLNSKRKSN
jgi:hypothetical protein